MLRSAWPIVVASCALLAACLDDQQALQTSDPIYTMVFFATDSVSLNKRAQDQLAKHGQQPHAADQGGASTQFEGQDLRHWTHGQGRPETINKEVAQRRADAVAKYLVELGVPQQRIVTASLGSSKPLVVTAPGTPEISNRRVEVVFGC